MRFAFPAFLFCALFQASAEERWKVQFFYDKPDAVFDIRDLACPSDARCVGAGVVSDLKDRAKGATVVTSDGGRHWTMEDFADDPVSLFFLPETPSRPGIGWMAAQRGIWKSEEGGRSWKKVSPLKGILQIYFLDTEHGFAIGFPKAIYETSDGGSTWAKSAAAQLAPGKPDSIVFQCIAFDGKQGIILGKPMSQRPGQYPTWMTPNAERYRHQREAPIFMLQTLDGGKNWKFDSAALVGDITELSFTKDNHLLALMEYRDLYELPSAVVRINLGAPGREAVFQRKDRAVRDIAQLDDGRTLLAAVEPPGTTNQVPVPGKLKILRSGDMASWEEMNVDYRADAQHATIAAPDARHAWVATDTGMILALEGDGEQRPKQVR